MLQLIDLRTCSMIGKSDSKKILLLFLFHFYYFRKRSTSQTSKETITSQNLKENSIKNRLNNQKNSATVIDLDVPIEKPKNIFGDW